MRTVAAVWMVIGMAFTGMSALGGVERTYEWCEDDSSPVGGTFQLVSEASTTFGFNEVRLVGSAGNLVGYLQYYDRAGPVVKTNQVEREAQAGVVVIGELLGVRAKVPVSDTSGLTRVLERFGGADAAYYAQNGIPNIGRVNHPQHILPYEPRPSPTPR